MHKKIKYSLLSLLFATLFLAGLFLEAQPVMAGQLNGSLSSGLSSDYQYYQVNEETGYKIYIEDGAGLFETSEIDELAETMTSISQYGNVGLVTTDSVSGSTESYAELRNEHIFGNDSVLFVIDMDNRYLYMDSMGNMRKFVTSNNADTITDNIYTYASDGDYFTCAHKAFEQVDALCSGSKIARPMKTICNIFLALIAAMLINYVIVCQFYKKKRPDQDELLQGMIHKTNMQEIVPQFVRQTKIYNPPSSSGGGGGHSGGGGGGGHSGGGHGF